MSRTVKIAQASGRTAPTRNWKRGVRRAWKHEKQTDPQAKGTIDWYTSPRDAKWLPSRRLCDLLPHEQWCDIDALRQQRREIIAGYALRRSGHKFAAGDSL